MIRSRSLYWLLAIVLLLAASARILVAAWWQARLPHNTNFFFGDSYSYWTLARTIAHGEPYAYGELRVFRTPGLPLLLSTLFQFDGEPAPIWGRIVVALAGTASVAATFLLGRRMFGAKVGLVSAAIMAVYPTNVFLGGMVLAEAPFATAMLLQLACWIAAWQCRRQPTASLAWAATAGVMAGAATLLRPSWLLFTPFAVLVTFLACTERGRHGKLAAVMLAVLALTMSPWWIRNHAVTGRFVSTTLQVGPSLYDGLHAAADGGSNMDFVAPLTVKYRNAWNELPPPQPPWESYLDDRFRQEAVQWAIENPSSAARLAMVKFVRTWNFWPNAEEFSATWMRVTLLFTYTPLLILAGCAIWRFHGLGWPVLLCCLPAVYLGLMHTIFVGSIRYREPALMPLAVLAGAWLVTQLGGKDSRHLPAHD